MAYDVDQEFQRDDQVQDGKCVESAFGLGRGLAHGYVKCSPKPGHLEAHAQQGACRPMLDRGTRLRSGAIISGCTTSHCSFRMHALVHPSRQGCNVGDIIIIRGERSNRLTAGSDELSAIHIR